MSYSFTLKQEMSLFGCFSDHFEQLWEVMGILHKNIQLILKFLKASFLVLHFSYYTLITFLMMFSVKLLSMLMIRLSNLEAIRHLICGNNQKWLLNLNLIYRTLCIGAGSGLLISMPENTGLVSFDWLNNTGALNSWNC